ncbi:MAG: YceI family protein [Acetobacteraceae bacterium]|nr:YceI family protein [Acetobacteraceae bacterium]
MKMGPIVGLALSAVVAGSAPGRGEPPRGFDADPAAVRAGTYQLDAAHGKITWAVSHFGLSWYRGQFVDLSGRLTIDPGQPERATLQVSVPLDKAGTFHEGLDAHLRNADFFDVPNHPTATFRSTRIERLDERRARVTGDLTLRGVTKPVAFVGTFNAAGVHPVTKRYTIGFGGEATVKRSEFGMAFAVPAVGDEVRLDLDVEFQLLE